MSDEIESEAPEELRRAQRRQIHAIGASTLSVVAVVAVTAIGVHAWHPASHPKLSSANVAASSQPLTETPATSEPSASASEIASDASPIESPSSAPSSSSAQSSLPSPGARPTPSTIDSKVSGEITLRLSMTATPIRVEFGQPVRVTVTIVNASRVAAHPDQLGVGTMRPTDTFNEIAPSCDIPQPGGVWCTLGVLRPGQRISLSFSITSASAPFSNDEVFANVGYVNAAGQQDDVGAQAPELTVLDDPGYLPPASPMTSVAPTSPSPSSTPSPAAPSTPAGSASPSITPSAS